MATRQAAFSDVLNREQDGGEPPEDDEDVDYLENEYVTEEGSTINTRINEDGVEEEQCPSCGNWYQRVSIHWSKSSCDHPPISQRKYEMAIGLMMGDGSVTKGKSNKNYRLRVKNTNITFLQWLQNEFEWLSGSICNVETAKEVADHLNKTGVNDEYRDSNPEDCYDVYELFLRGHPVFNKLRQWYKEDGLVFQEVAYTPTILRVWYVSDGGIDKQDMTTEFGSANESDRPEVIENGFANIGIDISNGDGGKHFRIYTNTDKFFDYIGHDPVPGFEYKWEYEDREQYERLKEQCDRKHKTQTLEG